MKNTKKNSLELLPTLLAFEELPPKIKEWADMLYPDGECREWYTETSNKVYSTSPQKALSVRYDKSPDKLRANVERMVEGFYKVLAKVSTPDKANIPSSERIYSQIVEAQKKVLAQKTRSKNEKAN